MNEQVSLYIEGAPLQQREIMLKLREIIHNNLDGVLENFKWSRPVFSLKSDFAYFKTSKDYLTFGFFHFEKIKNDVHLLEGTGNEMRHYKIKNHDDLNEEIIKKWLIDITS